jgi:hypothetical protein
MQENSKHYYKKQNTLRLSEADLDYIDENYLDIADTTEKLPIGKFFMNAISLAVGKVKTKEVIKEVEKVDPDQILKIENLQAQVEHLEQENAYLKSKIPNKEAIILNFAPKWRKYIWGVLQVSRKLNFAQTYEELIQKVFAVVNKRDELVLTEEDYQYLDTLDYPFTEPETEEKQENEQK